MKINQMYANNMKFANSMNYHNQKVRESDAKLSTGKVVNNPSDYVMISRLESSVKQSEVVQKQLDDNQSYLSTVQAVLETGKDIGLRLKELSTMYQSDTASKEEQKDIRKEAMGLTKELKDIFQKATFNGEKIFHPNKQGGLSTAIQLDIPDMNFINTLANKLDTTDIVEGLVNPLAKSLNSLQGALKSATTPVLSVQKASEAYKQNMESFSKKQVNPSDTDSMRHSSMSSFSVSKTSYAGGFISNMVSNTLKNIMAEHKEAIDYLSKNEPYQIYQDIKSQTYESLHNLSKEYGYEKEFLIADKLGVWDLIGLKKESVTTPKPPVENEIPKDTLPPDEVVEGGDGNNPEIPTDLPGNQGETDSGGIGSGEEASGDVEGVGNGETVTPPSEEETSNGQEGNVENSDKEGTSSTDDTPPVSGVHPPTNEDDNSSQGDNVIDVGIGGGGINIGIGNNGGNIDIDIDISLPGQTEESDTIVDKVGDVLEEMEEWFTPDFVDKEILDVISNAQADVDIKNRILEFRKSYETRMNQIEEERLARLQQVDISKELAEKAKNAMLEEINAYLYQWNMNHQQRMIDLMF